MTGMAQNDHLSMTLLFFKRQGESGANLPDNSREKDIR